MTSLALDPNLFTSRWSNLGGSASTPASSSRMLNIRVRGKLFQTREATLGVFPDTLLGTPLARVQFYSNAADEYVFDR